MPAIKKETSVTPFTIEANHPRNCDLLIQVINFRLRSAIKPTKEVFTIVEGEQVETTESAQMMKGLPNRLSGMRLSVNPEDGTYKVFDPLENDERALERVKDVYNRSTAIGHVEKIRPAKGTKGQLDKDQTKTLLREIYYLVENGHAKIVKGVFPELEEIEDSPGDFLLNSHNENNWRQPKYEKDLDAWDDKLNKLS